MKTEMRLLRRILLIILCLSAQAVAVAWASPPRPAEDAEAHARKWLDRDVAYLITQEEREVFLKLTTAAERDHFIEQFWLRRDPTPATSINEFKEEHYRRIAYADTYFGSGIPGWKTDRGRIYIIHGPPTEIEGHSAGGTYQRSRSEGGGTTSTFPFEIWRYRYLEGIGSDIEIEFVDRTLTGKYSMAADSAEKDALLRIPGAGKTLFEETGAASKADRVLGINQQQTFLRVGRRAKDAPFERLIQSANLNRPPSIRFKDLQRLVSARIAYRQLPFRLTWDRLWINDERVLLPITVKLDPHELSYRSQANGSIRRASVRIYGRITSISGRIANEFEEEKHFSPSERAAGLVMQHQVLLPPGRYRLEVVLEDLVGEKFGTSAVGVMIPSDRAGRTKISSLVLARKIEFLKSPPEYLEPFIFGDLRILPHSNSDFSRNSHIGIYFHVVGPRFRAEGPVPVELDYQILRDGEIVEEIDDQEGLTIHRQATGRIVAFAFLSLRKLSPGSYTVVVVCKERQGSMVSASRDFRVI